MTVECQPYLAAECARSGLATTRFPTLVFLLWYTALVLLGHTAHEQGWW